MKIGHIARSSLAFVLIAVHTLSPVVYTGDAEVGQAGPMRALQSLTTAGQADTPFLLEMPQAELSREYVVRHPMQEGSYITSEYGMRCDVPGVYSGCLFHSGMDFGNGPSVGWAAYPTARGVVSFVGAFSGAYPGCGYYVAVWHEEYDLTTVYCHLATLPYVQVGQYVMPDTPLGEVGTTGMSGGIHLHFMTVHGSAYDGPHYDPRSWFAQNNITP